MENRTVLYVDIPTSADISALTSHQGEACVSIYLRTTPVTQETRSDRIELKNLAKQAVHQLHAAGADKGAVATVADQLDDLVLLVEVSPDLPTTPVAIESLPKDAGRAVRGVGMTDLWPSGRNHAGEGQKVLVRHFARLVDRALRPLLTGSDIPLVLAAAEPLTSIYRSVNTYSHLANAMIEGNPESMSDEQLGARARDVLDGIYREAIVAWRCPFEERASQGRATTDISQTARAATSRAMLTLLVDIDEVIPGQLDQSGAVVFAGQPDPPNYDLVDQISGRVIAIGGRVMGVRNTDISRSKALAAILRYAAWLAISPGVGSDEGRRRHPG